MSMNQQAEQLNATIQSANPAVSRMLSRRGREIFFPSMGIIQQSADARGASINATIGTALEDDGQPMSLGVLRGKVQADPAAIFSYAPPYGRPELRDAWGKAMYVKNPSMAGLTVSKPVVTAALTHGLSMAGYLFVDEGDEIILPDLYWENYELLFGNAYGGRLATYPMFNDGGFNTAGLEKALSKKASGKRIVLLNFPNNPTGYTATVAETAEIRRILVAAAEAGNDMLVLIDDAYFGLVFEPGVLPESIFGLLAGTHERLLAVKFDGPTKEDYVWGFRVGFITFGIKSGTTALYGALEQKLAGAIRGNLSNVPNLSQTLLAGAYLDPAYTSQKKEKYEVLKRRYAEVKRLLSEHGEYNEVFTALPFNSGYFMCLETVDGIDADKVRRRLLAQYGTGVVALGRLLRLAFSSTPLGSIERLLDNIYRACLDVRAGT